MNRTSGIPPFLMGFPDILLLPGENRNPYDIQGSLNTSSAVQKGNASSPDGDSPHVGVKHSSSSHKDISPHVSTSEGSKHAKH